MRLYVNIDHVATIREARKTDEPDPVRAAVLVELAGADGITVHLREDRRHIQDRDVRLLAETCRSVLNLEVAAEDGVVDVAREIAPFQVTLVPERREEVTTEGGLDLASPGVVERVARATRRLQEAGIRISLFIDPSPEAVRASAELHAEAVEFHTGEYAHARTLEEREREVARLREAAALAVELGLAAHAGHGLTYENVAAVAAIPQLEELNIGHSIISRAVFVGMERAVQEMRTAMDRGRGVQARGTAE
ncbi:MAG: pyridoxine 5'-phosphate synthase [Gemmatimonadales bacterium]|nr:MAG: pyridoxine 5'-phosphate synthase [Gemmatimonadales bacterium]